MVPLASSQLAAWEIVSPMNGDETLTFGVALLGPKDLRPSRIIIRLHISLAPFYNIAAARLASVTLPIPRFVPGQTVVAVTLE